LAAARKKIKQLMEEVQSKQSSDENNVDLIKRLRSDLLKDFLDERYLKEYIARKFNVKELSNVKIEFIKKGLKELLQEPVDVTKYEKILASLGENGGESLSDGEDHVFYIEIENVLRQNIY
jgi:histone deacetylase complex regulatory component SIN3